MPDASSPDDIPIDPAEREFILRVFAAASFLIFFHAFLFAPLIPSLSKEFGATAAELGWLVPAYMLPYGLSTLVYGPISDRMGRRGVLLLMLAAISITILGSATAQTLGQLLAWRVAAGLASGGIIPISLALFGDLYPYAQRGRPLGWIFGAIAGGTAFGSTFGALLNPIVGWRWVLALIGVVCAIVFVLAYRHRELLRSQRTDHPPGLMEVGKSYLILLGIPRGRLAYAYIFANSLFHSGVFTWLGLFFAQRYGLSDQGIGLALLGYGVPGLLLGPTIGHIADRIGRRWIIPIGLSLAAVSALLLAPDWPLGCAIVACTILSLGFDMTHPLLAGMLTSLDPNRRGAAMGLNAFFLFTGYGGGALLFQAAMSGGFPQAFILFGVVQLALAALGAWFFRGESPFAGV